MKQWQPHSAGVQWQHYTAGVTERRLSQDHQNGALFIINCISWYNQTRIPYLYVNITQSANLSIYLLNLACPQLTCPDVPKQLSTFLILLSLASVLAVKNNQIKAILRSLQESSKTLTNIKHIMNNLLSIVQLINLIRTFKIHFD